MKKKSEERAPINFSLPETLADPVIVRRTLPDRRAEIIGRIFQDFKNEDGLVIYCAVNREGEGICLPTEDFGEVEDAFQKYAKRLEFEEWRQCWLELAERQDEISRIREGKRKHNEKQITI